MTRMSLLGSVLFATLLAVSLPLAAQKVVIENQGEASKAATAQMLTAEARDTAASCRRPRRCGISEGCDGSRIWRATSGMGFGHSRSRRPSR